MVISNIFFGQTIAATASGYAVRILIGSILAIGLILVLATPIHNRYHYTKKTFFTLISSIVVASTIAFVLIHTYAMSGSSANAIEKKQARITMSVCGQQIPIISEAILSSSIGTARQKIFEDGHMEYLGYVTDPARDTSLGSFFQAFGGSINSSVMILPYSPALESKLTDSATLAQFIRTNPIGERYLELQSGSSCTIYPSMISVFVYQYSSESNEYARIRLTQPESYIMSDQPSETSDCIVVIFGDPAQETNLRCGDYPNADRIAKKIPLGAVTP